MENNRLKYKFYNKQIRRISIKEIFLQIDNRFSYRQIEKTYLINYSCVGLILKITGSQED